MSERGITVEPRSNGFEWAIHVDPCSCSKVWKLFSLDADSLCIRDNGISLGDEGRMDQNNKGKTKERQQR